MALNEALSPSMASEALSGKSTPASERKDWSKGGSLTPSERKDWLGERKLTGSLTPSERKDWLASGKSTPVSARKGLDSLASTPGSQRRDWLAAVLSESSQTAPKSERKAPLASPPSFDSDSLQSSPRPEDHQDQHHQQPQRRLDHHTHPPRTQLGRQRHLSMSQALGPQPALVRSGSFSQGGLFGSVKRWLGKEEGEPSKEASNQFGTPLQRQSFMGSMSAKLGRKLYALSGALEPLEASQPNRPLSDYENEVEVESRNSNSLGQASLESESGLGSDGGSCSSPMRAPSSSHWFSRSERARRSFELKYKGLAGQPSPRMKGPPNVGGEGKGLRF